MSITISQTVAIWMVQLGRRLLQEGLGTPFPSDDIEQAFDSGFIDDIDSANSPEFFNWVNAMIMFIRTLTAIAVEQIGEENIPMDYISDLTNSPDEI